MRIFLSITIAIFLSELSDAQKSNEVDDISMEYNDNAEYDYDLVRGKNLNDSDVEIQQTYDDFRQIIFNPRKRRERRKKRKGKYQNLV